MRSNGKTPILLFHPALTGSEADLAMALAAAGLPRVEVMVRLANRLGRDPIRDAEAPRLLAADRIVPHVPMPSAAVDGVAGQGSKGRFLQQNPMTCGQGRAVSQLAVLPRVRRRVRNRIPKDRARPALRPVR